MSVAFAVGKRYPNLKKMENSGQMVERKQNYICSLSNIELFFQRLSNCIHALVLDKVKKTKRCAPRFLYAD